MALQEALVRAVQDLKGDLRIFPEARARIEKELGIGTTDLLRQLLPLYRERAIPVVSGFHVAAIGLGRSGTVYGGMNLEYTGGQINQTVHAEQCLVANVLQAEGEELERIVVSAPPCGHCRQFLNELPWAADSVVDVPSHGVELRLRDLLPYSFGPSDLGSTSPLGKHGRVDWLEVAPESGPESELTPLARAAVEAARAAYAPYSACFAGVALQLGPEREQFVGSYLENCAFNPSLSPLQCALARAVCAGHREAGVTRAVLAERDDLPLAFSHRATTEALLERMAPGVQLTVVALRGRGPGRAPDPPQHN